MIGKCRAKAAPRMARITSLFPGRGRRALTLAVAPAVMLATLLTASAASAAAPVRGAAAHVPAVASAPAFTVHCSGTGTAYRVTQNNISIRSRPGGSIKHSISKGATFLSRGFPGNDRGRTCVSSVVNGTTWVYGIGKSNLVLGWVGTRWLKVTGHGGGD